MKKISIKEIAKKSGFGVGTVSRALSDEPYLVKKETREKILAVAREYGYIKNYTARTLVTGRSRDIGLVIPAIFGSLFYNDYYIKIISGIMAEASSCGYKVRLLLLEVEGGFSDIMADIRSMQLEGVIMSYIYYGDFYIAKKDIREVEVPVVVLSEEVRGKNIRSVVLDDFKGGYDGASYLIGLGHKKIGIIRGIYKDIEDRYKGYLEAMADKGIEIDNDFVMQGEAAIESEGYRLTMDMIEKGKMPTALFCLDDELAVGAMRAMEEKGLNCPGDISVLGYDNMDISRFTSPRLTTMARPVIEMGKKSVEMLLSEELRKERRCFKVKAEITERGSCRKV